MRAPCALLLVVLPVVLLLRSASALVARQDSYMRAGGMRTHGCGTAAGDELRS
jgi:hypothetical protein